MKYNILDTEIPQDKRDGINKKILSLIGGSDMKGITEEDIFNAYTGVGGLHGLDKKDFANYHQYSEAKKEIEQGQFFTPHTVCKEMSELLKPSVDDLVADITCGMGNFFNYFEESNCYGCDIDSKAVSVAKFLYPKANITTEDFRYFDPKVKVDFVIGNPPFNISVKDPELGYSIQSQFFFFLKSSRILKPGGLILAVVPESFLADAFFNKSNIESIEQVFSFVGQYKLPKNAFAQMGVNSFATKIMCWQRVSDSIDTIPYDATSFITKDELSKKIDDCLQVKNELRLKLHRELIQSDDKVFEYKVKKYIYELKTHKNLQPYYSTAMDYLDKYSNQKCPPDMEFDYWYKHNRITDKMVLSYLKRTVAKQVKEKQVDKIELVKTNYSIKIKAYSSKTRTLLNKKSKTLKDLEFIKLHKLDRNLIEAPKKEWLINDLIIDIDDLPDKGKYKNLINRKINNYQRQNTSFNTLERDAEIDAYLRRFYFIDKENKKCYFNKIQRHDLGLIIQKQYSVLAWQMGGGKTAGALSWAKFNPQRNTFIVSASLAINLTWMPFLNKNRVRYVLINTLRDIERINPGDFVLLSFHFVTKYEKALKKYVKMQNKKVNLIFDESDEITNSSAQRTKSVMNIFRKVKRKLLTTGTTTRNNIGELYSQLEILYNNSCNLISWSEYYFVEDKKTGDIDEKSNKYFEKPFPPYTGQTMFKRCFNPSKSTVFGIQKQNQDIYNESELKKIIEKTIITRKFREIAGDKYKVETVLVKQDQAERDVYRTIIKELDRILPEYFNSTGNSRKDALLRAMRQLSLLIDATSKPQTFSFYSGSGVPKKAEKIFDLIDSYDEKVAVGCTSIEATDWYENELKLNFPNRSIFKITGSISFKQRNKIIENFEATNDGILVCTQQSLKSSVNIPTCDKVIIESLQWNIPKIEQFYFRFIRYNSENETLVIFVNYENTIEVNLLALLMAKERLNDYIKTLDYKENSDIYKEYDIDLDILNSLITKQKDDDGNIQISWGEAEVKN